MKIVKTPRVAYELFTDSQLSGWEDGVTYTAPPPKPKRKPTILEEEEVYHVVTRIDSRGKKLI